MDYMKAEIDKEFESVGFKDKKKTLKVSAHQIGKSIKAIDVKRKALSPGKRMSKTG